MPLHEASQTISYDRIQLKPATADDEQFVNDLTRTTMRPYVEATWSDEPSRENYYFINRFVVGNTSIILHGAEPAGRITVTRGDTEIVLDEIHLLPEFQGHGIGAKMIRELLDEAHTGGKTVALIVLKTNPAKGLYERLGFEVYSETPERYFMRTRA